MITNSKEPTYHNGKLAFLVLEQTLRHIAFWNIERDIINLCVTLHIT